MKVAYITSGSLGLPSSSLKGLTSSIIFLISSDSNIFGTSPELSKLLISSKRPS
jgi:hypothetical protein